MSNYRIGKDGQLYDFATGSYVGHLDANGKECLVLGVTPSDGGITVGAPDATGRMKLLAVSVNQAIHHLELQGSKRAKAGPDFVCDIDGNQPIVNHVGRVMRGKTHEMVQMGMNRVENLARPLTDTDATYGWVAGANTAVTVLDEPDFDGDKEIYRITRTSGSGVLMTYRSRQYTNGASYGPNKWYEPGVYVCSFEARSASAYPVVVSAINNTDSAVLGTVTFTPDGEFDQDRRVFFAFTVTARTQFVKLQISCATSGAFVLDLQRFQAGDKTGQTAVPSRSAKYGKDYGTGAAGVRYFADTDHYTDLGGGLCKPAVSATPIAKRTMKGYAISPPWTNKLLQSDNFNTTWVKTAVQLGAAGDSVAFGAGTMQRLELDATAATLHEVKQAFSGSFTQSKSTTFWVPYATGDWTTFEIGFVDAGGVVRSASVDLATKKTVSVQGAPDPYKVHWIPAGLLGDKPYVGFTASSGVGASAPVAFIRFSDAAGASAAVGAAAAADQGKGSWFGRASFAHVDLPLVPLSVTTTATISGNGTGTNGIALSSAIPKNNFTVIYDITIYDDDENPGRSAWVQGAYFVDPSRVLDTSVTPNVSRADLRGGTARRPGAWGGAAVEGFIDPNTGLTISGLKKWVADFYRKASGINPNTGLWQEIFSVVMADVQFKAGSTVRVYFSLGSSDTGNGSNLLMRVAGQAGVFDLNSHPNIEELPPGQTLNLGYNAQAGSAISLQAFKNLEVRGYAMTAAEMSQHWLDNPLF